MKKLVSILTMALIVSVSFSQTFNLRGKIENAKGKTRVVMYGLNGQNWDTVWIDNFRSQYSLMLDPDMAYQIWFFSLADSVKVLTVDKKAIKARTIIVDVDFNRKGSARVAKGNGKHPFNLLLLDVNMTSANRPEDLNYITK
jgi:hypothetical protein